MREKHFLLMVAKALTEISCLKCLAVIIFCLVPRFLPPRDRNRAGSLVQIADPEVYRYDRLCVKAGPIQILFYRRVLGSKPYIVS